MERKRNFILLNYLMNKNIKLCLKLIENDEKVFKLIEKREMRKGLKYCIQRNSDMVDVVLGNNNILIKRHLRLPKLAFNKLVELCPVKHHGYNPNIEVGITLFWLACGTSYRVASTAFNIPTTSIYYIVQRTMDFILTLLKQIIVFPNQGEYERVGMKFGNRAGSSTFNKALGAIDGTHIKIKCPVNRHDEYINRKLDYSIQLQAICDAEHKFLNICAGWPGSVHDQRVLRNSDVYISKKYPPPGYFLLGDSGYQLTLEPIAIITPYTENRRLTPAEKRFNHLHSKARIAVEQAFGQMKTRWRCIFLRSLEINIKNCVKVIAICCILHNICLDVGDLMHIDAEFRNEDHNTLVLDENHQTQSNASEFRDHLCIEI